MSDMSVYEEGLHMGYRESAQLLQEVRKLLREVRTERDEWRRCAEYALHLAQYGESAPGGDETWAELERMMRALKASE